MRSFILTIVIMVALPLTVDAADDSLGISTANECSAGWINTGTVIVVSAYVVPDVAGQALDSARFGMGYNTDLGDSGMAVVYDNLNGEPNNLLDSTEHLRFNDDANCAMKVAAFVENATLTANDSIWIGQYLFHVTTDGKSGFYTSGHGEFFKQGVTSVPTTWPTGSDTWDGSDIPSTRIYFSTATGGSPAQGRRRRVLR